MRRLITLAAAAALVLAACGGGGDDDADTTTPPTAPDTTAAPAELTPPAASATTATGGYVPGADPEADAAALAWTTAFDSAMPFEHKAVVIEDAEDLRPTIEAYAATGTQMGGITLVPTDAVVTGPVATITSDIQFAGQQAYSDQTGAVALVDGAWIVQRDEFCAFMALARSGCPA